MIVGGRRKQRKTLSEALLGLHSEEAEPHLSPSSYIDPARSSAFKNLGLSYCGLSRFPKTVEQYIAGFNADASDPRLLRI